MCYCIFMSQMLDVCGINVSWLCSCNPLLLYVLTKRHVCLFRLIFKNLQLKCRVLSFEASLTGNHPLRIIYRVEQEECARLREGVPYVKVYRYNPKHLYPKLNGLGDNGNWKLWTSFGSRTIAVSWVSLSADDSRECVVNAFSIGRAQVLRHHATFHRHV